jgi:hypothetical protein
MTGRRIAWWIAALAALAVCPEVALAVKTDTVILRNGDHITGEVKGLARGKLDYSTDDAGRLSIEWEKIARLTSPNPFDAEDIYGVRHFGRLSAADREGFVVFQNSAADTLPITNVVEITPLNASFLERVMAYLDLGFTLAKANQATTLSLSGEVDYRGPKIGSQFNFDSYEQGQEGVPTTTRNTLRQSVSWFLPKRWSAVALAQFEQNDELNLDHRWTGGGAMSRALSHTNSREVSFGLGLVGTQEQFSTETGTSSSTSLEGLASLNWDAFRFDSPKLDFNLSLATFPSISDAGRVRGQGQLRLQYEVFKDFNAGIRFSDTFDSRPIDETATKNDYVTTFTIGWSYRR